MSRALNQPVAIVSTSGTAAANFFPAVVEACYSHVPILILTADRPPELWEWGANQTIDQTRMYGGHTKWSVNMASPEMKLDLLRYVREMTCRALSTAIQSPAGPVQINFPFGEPLVPKIVPSDIPEQTSVEVQDAWEGRKKGRPYTDVQNGRRSTNIEKVKELGSEIQSLRNGIIVCGPQDDLGFPHAVSTLANRLGFPILADPLSQVRCGIHDRGLNVDCYDDFLRSTKMVRELEPEIILRFGATPTSKALQNYIEQNHRARQILIQEGNWQDPMHTATDMVQTDPNQFARELAAETATRPKGEWSGLWMRVAERTRQVIHDQMSKIEEMFEGKIFTNLATFVPNKATLFAGNSMPVRDLDSFYPSTSQEIRFLSNRGASGIDGVISTALGASVVTQEPTVLVVGDLSFYQDMNGLLAAKKYNPNTTIVLANNDGGGIFSFLAQREYEDYFEKYFATPHGLTFQAAASLYGLTYSKVTSWEEFHTAVSRNIGSKGTAVVELQTDRDRNVELHRRIWSLSTEAAESTLTERT